MVSAELDKRIDDQKSEILRLIARDFPIDTVLDAICRTIEGIRPGTRASILRNTDCGKFLYGCVAPSMGADYVAVVDGFATGPRAACCGTAVYRGERVITEDVETDALWDGARDMARKFDIRSCWSEPVLSPEGTVIGTFALYRRAPARPSSDEIALVGALADLTSLALQKERRRGERIETAQRLTGLMHNIPGTVLQWSVSPSGREAITFASDGVAEMTGLDAETVRVRPPRLLARIARAERAPLIAALRKSVGTMTAVRWDFSIRQADGSTKWVRLVSRPRPDGGGGVVCDALALDITDRHETETRLEESRAEINQRVVELHRTKARLESQSATLMEVARELTAARDVAEEASRAKSEFLSNMTHELRTPLNAIIGFSEIIKEQTFGPVGSAKYRTYAHDIHDAGRHLLELINEILDFAKLESGTERLLEDDFAIDEAVDAVVRMVRDSADRASVTLNVNLPQQPLWLRADKRKIRQILINLLSNAIKFTRVGGCVTLAVWSRPESGLVMQVVDTGIGMELADIPKALGVFGQVDSAFSRNRSGTGLGLPLTKALCEMHGGSLDLQSQPGVGTTVTIRIPSGRVISSAGENRTAADDAATGGPPAA